MRAQAVWLPALLVLAAAAPAHAQGCNALGVTPVRIELAGAQAGQAYHEVLSVQNPCSFQRSISTERDGTAGGWATLSPSSFDLPATSTVKVEVFLQVPTAQGPGSQTGFVRFVAAPTSAPGGSGQAVSAAVAVPLNVTVGGQAVTKITWSLPRAEDAAEGAEAHAFATARNEGNVRATVTLRGEVLPLAGDTAIANATGSLALDPGDQKEILVAFKAGLPVGQYRAHLQADAFDETVPFKVVAPGTLPPDGALRAILHAARVTAGQPARLDAWFQNTGAQPIRSAQFKAEVRKDGVLLAPLQSDALAVAPGQSVNLTVYWTPPTGGTYAIAGNVLYDGFLTAESQSLLNVDPANATWPWWLWLVLAALLLVIFLIVWRMKRSETRARSR